jgi:hypothetical protein
MAMGARKSRHAKPQQEKTELLKRHSSLRKFAHTQREKKILNRRDTEFQLAILLIICTMHFSFILTADKGHSHLGPGQIIGCYWLEILAFTVPVLLGGDVSDAGERSLSRAWMLYCTISTNCSWIVTCDP